MYKTEEIQDRLERGYTMAIYGTRENIHEQMTNDIKTLLKAINYTRCSTQLKDKKTITFDEFAKENNYKQNFLYFYRDGKTFKPSEIMKRYKTYLLNL